MGIVDYAESIRMLFCVPLGNESRLIIFVNSTLVLYYYSMTSLFSPVTFPDRAEAIDRIHQFGEVDPQTMRKPSVLIKNLGGVSLALSALADGYGTTLDGFNIGMSTHVGEGDNRHKFSVSQQEPESSDGAHIGRSAIVGGTDKYYDFVVVPTDKTLQYFTNRLSAEQRPGFVPLRYSEIYASHVRTPDEGERVYEEYFPFYNSPSRGAECGRTAADDAVKYTETLLRLSATMLELLDE